MAILTMSSPVVHSRGARGSMDDLFLCHLNEMGWINTGGISTGMRNTKIIVKILEKNLIAETMRGNCRKNRKSQNFELAIPSRTFGGGIDPAFPAVFKFIYKSINVIIDIGIFLKIQIFQAMERRDVHFVSVSNCRASTSEMGIL